MFNYPLPNAGMTLYHRLGILPTATEQQIRTAIADQKEDLLKRKRGLERKLNRINTEFPELETLKARIESLKKTSTTDAVEALRKAIDEKRSLEKKAETIEPAYRDIISELKEIERKINELNSLKLDNTRERNAYDLRNPPCALLKLKAFEDPLFSEPEVALTIIRREIANFLAEENNMVCYHPSDLTRTDFTADFNYHPILDGEE